MTTTTRYAKPYPRMTDRAGGWYCRAVAADGWLCTRPDGHNGDHEAGNAGGLKFASWPQVDGDATDA